ncbi:hypothetical protein [Azospirillum melinis]
MSHGAVAKILNCRRPMPAPTCGRFALDPSLFHVHPADGGVLQSTP